MTLSITRHTSHLNPYIHCLKMGMNAAKMGKIVSSTAISSIAMKALGSIPKASAGRPFDDPYVRCMNECDKLSAPPNGDGGAMFLCQIGCWIATFFQN